MKRELVIQVSLEKGGFEQYREDISSLALNVSTDSYENNNAIIDQKRGNWEQFNVVKLSKLLKDPNFTVDSLMKKFSDLGKNVAKDLIENKDNIFKGSLENPFVSSKGRHWVSINGELFYNSKPNGKITFGKVGDENIYINPENKKNMVSVKSVDVSNYSWVVNQTKFFDEKTKMLYDLNRRPFSSYKTKYYTIFKHPDAEKGLFRLYDGGDKYTTKKCNTEGYIIDE
jgi:hypothetical protein